MRLALPRSFALDGALLEKAYFAAQRQFHPDRFATRPAPERLEALQQATAINEAYEVLKSLRGRAERRLRTRLVNERRQPLWSGSGTSPHRKSPMPAPLPRSRLGSRGVAT